MFATVLFFSLVGNQFPPFHSFALLFPPVPRLPKRYLSPFDNLFLIVCSQQQQRQQQQQQQQWQPVRVQMETVGQ
jgi:hypothetical protein